MNPKTVAQASKKVITPYAFKVASDLIGMPLASPTRRLTAIFIDMALVALLTTLSNLILTGLIGILALVGANSLRKKGGRELAALFLSVLFVGCLIIVAAGIFLANDLEIVSDAQESSIQLTESEEREPESSEVETSDPSDIELRLSEPVAPSMIDWVEAAFRDLGISFGWAAVYFTAFVAWMNGQTPGKMIFGIRVIRIDGRELGLWDSFGRYGGYGAGLATGLLGFLQIYWDNNRQAIQDKISETMVIDVRKPKQSISTMPDNGGDSEAAV